MNVTELSKMIGQIAKGIRLVHSYYDDDLKEVWNTKEVKYGSVVWNVSSVSLEDNIWVYNGYLYYGDRLNEAGTNINSIFSDATTVIQTIISVIYNNVDLVSEIEDYPAINYFKNKYADELAGCYVSLNIKVANEYSSCDDGYDVRTLLIKENGLYNVTGYDMADVEVQSGSAFNIIPGENITITKKGEDKIISAVNMRYDDTEVKGMIEDVADEVDSLNEVTIPEIVPTTTNFTEGSKWTITTAFERTANLFAGYWNYIKSNITDLIPSTATVDNKLADKAFVNETVAQNAANFRGNWSNWSAVPDNADSYPVDYVGNHKPTNNDYLVVTDASGYSTEYDGSWRFLYTGDWDTLGKSGWNPAYRIGSAFTDVQQAAIDSTITKDKVDTYDGYESRIVANETNKVDKINTANKIYGTATDGTQTEYIAGSGINLVEITHTDSEGVVTKTHEIQAQGYTKVVTKEAPNIQLLTNEYTVATTDVDTTITLDTVNVLTDGLNEYRLQLSVTAPVRITFNIVGLKWSYDTPDYLVSGKTYEFSIINNHGTYLVF